MPNYEFSCADCGAEFSLEMPLCERANAEIRCPACGGARTEQVYRAVHINTRKAGCDSAGGCGCGGCCHEC